ncbi:predicted protein [Botrytis cinerea T4]|uniref:Uncharacterized protein n=1 Tax=Botryotinia fuckeliana (strain T4) TaxID=999810 RepID=G2Y968_BOTF4|nr:predicted protein [Botrytis cinerea T4]
MMGLILPPGGLQQEKLGSHIEGALHIKSRMTYEAGNHELILDTLNEFTPTSSSASPSLNFLHSS